MKEKISALLDGELSPEEARAVRAYIATNSEAQKIWAEYQAIRRVVREPSATRISSATRASSEASVLIWSAAALTLVGAIGMATFLEHSDEPDDSDPLVISTLQTPVPDASPVVISLPVATDVPSSRQAAAAP